MIDSEFSVCGFSIDGFAEIIWDSIKESKVMNKVLTYYRKYFVKQTHFLGAVNFSIDDACGRRVVFQGEGVD